MAYVFGEHDLWTFMKINSYDMEDQAWIRDQTARILHRHIASGKHFRIDVDALLERVRRLRTVTGA